MSDSYEINYDENLESGEVNDSNAEIKIKCEHIVYDPTGFETWTYYDENGLETHYKNSDGYERWTEYTDTKRISRVYDTEGKETNYIYNDDNLLIKVIEGPTNLGIQTLTLDVENTNQSVQTKTQTIDYEFYD